MTILRRLAARLSRPSWGRDYSARLFASDAVAAVIVTIMLIPQSLAYALLAGLPPEMGLYASMLPLVAYALFGTSRTLSVGPVAVISLMTATAVGRLAEPGSMGYASAAIALAALSGLMLLGMGLLRLGFLSNFLSHPVVSGFITASGLIIALSQLRHILGVDAGGDTLPSLVLSLWFELHHVHGLSLVIGTAVTAFLFWARRGLQPLLLRCGFTATVAGVVAKGAPVLAIVVTTLGSYFSDFAGLGVAVVGDVPRGLPAFALPAFEPGLWRELALPALLLSVIGYVESVSVGRTLAAKRRQRIDPDRELIALGTSNLAAAVSGGYAVSGGFSRSVVNFDAGAQTQMASVMAAACIALVALLFTPALFHLPQATLAATIIVAVSSLIDLEVPRVAWRFSRADFLAAVSTIGGTLLLGVELGVLTGMATSIALHLYRTSRPHIAVVGAVAGTEHFRNVQRHNVITHPNLVSVRVDESLYFANASFLEEEIYRLVADNPELEHVILQCTAVNDIDLSALQALVSIDHRLRELGLQLHLSEVKGPVMDALGRAEFLDQLSGRVFMTHYRAVQALKRDEGESYVI